MAHPLLTDGEIIALVRARVATWPRDDRFFDVAGLVGLIPNRNPGKTLAERQAWADFFKEHHLPDYAGDEEHVRFNDLDESGSEE